MTHIRRAVLEQTGDDLRMFDAEAWALAHYLMFGKGGGGQEPVMR